MPQAIGNMPAADLLGLLTDLNTKLRSGALTIHQLVRFLQKKNPFEFPSQITIGNFGSKYDIENKIRAAGGSLVGWANIICGLIDFLRISEPAIVRLVVLTPESIGLPGGLVDINTFIAKARLSGYRLCPAEVGPQLRLDYMWQGRDEELFIGMEPVIHLESQLVFRLDLSDVGAPALGGIRVSDISTKSRWVFLPPAEK